MKKRLLPTLYSFLGNNQFLSLAGNVAVSGLGIVSVALLYRALPIREVGMWIFFISTIGLADAFRTGFLTTAFIRACSGATPARAVWGASVTGTATLTANTVPSAAPVTAQRTGVVTQTVSATWTAVTVGGAPVLGYDVVRWRTPVLGTPAQVSGFGGCEGRLTATSCVDSGSLLGLGGTFYYVVTPVFTTAWIGPPATSNTA